MSRKKPSKDSYIPLPRSFLINLRDLSGNGVKVFIHILLSASWRPPNQGMYAASYTQIGTDLKMLRQTVYRAVKELSPSLIHVDPGKNQFSASTFTVNNFRTTRDFGNLQVSNSGVTGGLQHGDSKSLEANASRGFGASKNEKKNKKIYEADSEEFRLALLLKERILGNNPNNRIKNSDDIVQRWARIVNLMIRKDKRNPSEIKAIIDFCQSHDFWYKNILSMEKLRKQYDRLYLELNPISIDGHQNGARPTDILVN